MATLNYSKKPWTAQEIAFILGYADLCIHRGFDYPATVADELRRLSSRNITSSSICRKLERTLKSYGINEPSAYDLINRGMDYVGVKVLPVEVRSELDGMRQEWGFSPLSTDKEDPETPTSNVSNGAVDKTKAFSTEKQLQSGKNASRQPETLQVEDTPEPQQSRVPTIDGAADRPTMSPFTPDIDSATDRISSPEYGASPLSSAKQHAGKRRALTPEDKDDHEYAPSPKRRKSNSNSSGHASHTECRSSQAVPFTKTSKNAKGTKTNDGATQTAGSPRSQASIKTHKRTPDLIIIDDASEELQAAGSSSQLSYKGTHPNQPTPSSLDQNDSKRKADVMSDGSSSMLELSSEKQKTDDLTLEAVNNKVNACLSILQSLVTHQSDVPEETAEHLHQVIRTFKDPEGSVIENLMKDLESHRRLKAKHRDMVQKLVEFVNLDTGNSFPKEPPQQEVDQIWRAIHEHIVSIVGANNTSPKISALSAGYLACSAENIAYGRIPQDQLKTYLESLAGPLRSPYTQQTILGALICRWVLSDPEPMLNTMHSQGMMQLYNGVLSSASTTLDGLATVQQYDKTATKLMFEDPDFQKLETEPRAHGLSSNIELFKNKWCKKSNIPPSKRPGKFAGEVVKLKQRLLLSPKHYRIRYVRPGTLFDPHYMQAFDHANVPIPDAKAADRKVLLCTFPAFTCEEGKAVKEDAKIDDILIKNKRFASTLGESTESKPESRMSKATVLISMEEAPEKR
ncbi:hypothetical protein N0V86_003033 [Didymella sp. IMI 355093]|nr:hypothetical protein N0V86_003033 [Didymella sp. IMI 355093]